MRLPVTLAAILGLAASASGTQVRTGAEATFVVPETQMVRVASGTFLMGITDTELEDVKAACYQEFGAEVAQIFCEQILRFEDARTQEGRMVFVSSFEIDRHEVSVRDYRACVAEGGCDVSPLVSGDSRYAQDELPMVNVTWADADTFCRWRGKRLPTEAEWEKAARGSDARRWPWGMSDGDDRANRGRVQRLELRSVNPLGLEWEPDEDDGHKVMAPAGSFRLGRSPYGVQDMSGNVAEWVSDWYSTGGYKGISNIDPRGAPSGTAKVHRGGSFFEPRFYSRTYYRNGAKPAARMIYVGFRCARNL
jgi:formylglycine-generating enzyme required for sulfatase activity